MQLLTEIRLYRAGLAALLVTLLAACTPAGTPSAQDILSKPNSANLRDAHFVLTGTLVNNGSTLAISGDGQIVYRSAPQAGRFTYKAMPGGRPIIFEDVYVNGMVYGRAVPGSGKWTARASSAGLGPGSFRGDSDFVYYGEEDLALGRAWHARARDKAGNTFEAWIRKSDGYPLKYQQVASNTKANSNMTLTFDSYNTGATIVAPPVSEVVQG